MQSSSKAAQMIHQLVQHNFPPVKFIMAYGSGVFQQVGYKNIHETPTAASTALANESLPMIDLILAVENSKQWHKDNLEQNTHHYSSLMKLCGSSVIEKVQRNFGAQIYYHPFVQLPMKQGQQGQDDAVQLHNRVYKYGVIEESDLVNDLNEWNTLYVSGRLHKPCLIRIADEGDVELRESLKKNLYAALKVACIMLYTSPPTSAAPLVSPDDHNVWNLNQLFMMICSLSYTGDIRMQMGGYGENQNKVANIVDANFEKFLKLYLPLLRSAPFIQMIDSEDAQGKFTIIADELKNVEDLPSNLVTNLSGQFGSVQAYQKALTQIVKQTSTSQSLKGILTAGVRKSYIYALEKIKKGTKAKKQSV